MARKFFSMGSLLSLCFFLGLPSTGRAQKIVNEITPAPRLTSVPAPRPPVVVRTPASDLSPYMTSINYPLIYGSYAMFPYAIPPSFTSSGAISSSIVDQSMRPPRVVTRSLLDEPAVPARITVVTPRNADVYFQNMQMPMSGTVKRFASPALNPQLTYSYDVRAMWRENGEWVNETRRIVVRAGDDVTVTFASPTAPLKEMELPSPGMVSPGSIRPQR